MSKPANPVEKTDTLQDQAMQRSNTDNAPRSAIHQTLYSADTFVQHDYLAGKKLARYCPSARRSNQLAAFCRY